MSLRFAAAPKNGSELVLEGLTKLLRRPQAPPGAIRALTVQNSKITPPHAIYDLRADEIAKGAGLESARLTGYQYLVSDAAGPVATAEVHADATGTAQLLATLNFGPYVQAMAGALAKVMTLDDVAKGSYEARGLRFSAIWLMALWLKADSGGHDFVYPLAPAPSGVQAERLYAPKEFLAAILPMAKRRAASTGTTVP